MEQSPAITSEKVPFRLRRLGGWMAVAAVAVAATTGILMNHKTSPTGSEFSTTPTWQQDFASMHDSPPDPNVWRYDLNPEVPTWNNERQGYTDRLNNVRIEAGRLVLDGRREPYTYPSETKGRSYDFTSARIDTQHSFAFRYGKLEASMKLPEGGGAWPAFWLLSATDKYSEDLQPSLPQKGNKGQPIHESAADGEIDIMEYSANDGCDIYSTVHTYDTVYRDNPDMGKINIPDCTTTFHTYGLEWTPRGITFTVDGRAYHTVTKTSDDPKKWPFDQPMYIILNLALGGDMGGEIDPATSLWRTEIQHVSYFSYKEKAG